MTHDPKRTVYLVRWEKAPDATFGTWIIPDVGQWATVEQPWRGKDDAGNTWPYGWDKRSCIPEGEYELQLHVSPTYEKHMWYIIGEGVVLRPRPGNPEIWRESVMVHPANLASQLQGCVAPGMCVDMDNRQVLSSRTAMAAINKALLAIDRPRLVIRSVN